MPHFAFKQHGRGGGATAGQQAAYIMRDVETSETKAYVEYVLRQSRNAEDREDLAWSHAGNMPVFGEDNPVKFFLAADRHEGANRRVSSSLEVALPRELSRESQIALIEDFCSTQFPRSPYLVGLHESTGASGEPNPHFHVTWSERINDGRECSEEDFFRRPPHGAGKDPLYHEERWLLAARQNWSDLANVALEREGVEGAFIDLRSLRDRGIDRRPEPRLSPLTSTLAKRDGVITDQWQRVLNGRKARAGSRDHEQRLATEAWQIRKDALGLVEITSLERDEIVARMTERMRVETTERVPKVTLRDLREEQASLEVALTQATLAANRGHVQVMTAEHRTRQPAAHGADDLTRVWEQPLIANRASGIYHTPEHKNYGDVTPKNQVHFWTEREAQEAGYRRAANDHYGPGSGKGMEAHEGSPRRATAASIAGPGEPAEGRRGRRGSPPSPRVHDPSPGPRRTSVVPLMEEEDHGGLLAPDLDKKRGKDGYDW